MKGFTEVERVQSTILELSTTMGSMMDHSITDSSYGKTRRRMVDNCLSSILLYII